MEGNPAKQRWKTGVFFLLSGLIAATWSSRIPEVQKKLELQDAAWGTVLFALPAGLVSGLLLSSWLISRFGTKKIILFAMIISALLLFALGISGRQAQVMIFLFLLGFMRTVLNMSINTHAVVVQQSFARPILSKFHGIWSIACFAAAGIGQLMIILNIIPAIHFTWVSVLVIVAVILNSRSRNNNRHVPPEKRPLLVKPDAYLWLLGGIAFCGMIGENIMFDWSINYFDQVIETDKHYVTLGYICFISMMSIGRLTGDRLVHRYGHLKILFANGILMSAGFFIVALFPQLATAATGCLLIGIGDATIVPVVYSLAAQTSKMPPNYALASVTIVGYCGFLTGPLLMGTVSQNLGMSWGFFIVGIMATGISLLSLRIKKYKN